VNFICIVNKASIDFVYYLPAKLKFARWSASDVHAALIFLDWPLTFGAGFAVCKNPAHTRWR
jgi:hypothetical protein